MSISYIYQTSATLAEIFHDGYLLQPKTSEQFWPSALEIEGEKMQVFPYEKSGNMKVLQQKITIFEAGIFDKLAFVFGVHLSCLKILSILAKLSSEIPHFFYLLSRSVRAWEIPVSVFVVASSLVHVCSATGELNTCSLACSAVPCFAVG